jgi:hypothetical protein
MRAILKIRLSTYFYLLLAVFLVLAFKLPHIKFEAAALTLFSVNSFLYGFYIAPILSAQKTRVEELHKIVRSEANSLFGMLIATKKLKEKPRNKLQDMFEDYIDAEVRDKKPGGGEKQYEALITYCLEYKGEDKEVVGKILDQMVANQTNRSQLSMQLSNKVYSNEWWVMLVLFSITLVFVLLLDVGAYRQLHFVQAFLCTGLTMLLVILLKMSTLTHKKAGHIWDPLKKLVDTRFYRMD